MKWEPTRFGGFRRVEQPGVAQSREERHSDGMEDGTSQVSPGTTPVIRPDKRKWEIAWREVLGLPECPYVYRWRFETPFGSVRVHHWVGNDDARHLHDHPWPFVTLVFRGAYWEMTPDGPKRLQAPTMRYRAASYRHAVFPDTDQGPVWTVIFTGPRIRNWGFWVLGKFVKANKYFAKHGHHPCD